MSVSGYSFHLGGEMKPVQRERIHSGADGLQSQQTIGGQARKSNGFLLGGQKRDCDIDVAVLVDGASVLVGFTAFESDGVAANNTDSACFTRSVKERAF